MSVGCSSGEFVRGELSSANASGGVAIVLYNAAGVVRTLGARERLVIYDVAIVSAPGGAIALTANTDAAGFRLLRGTVAANGGIAMDFQRALECPLGVTPKMFAPAGQVDVSLVGEIIKS